MEDICSVVKNEYSCVEILVEIYSFNILLLCSVNLIGNREVQSIDPEILANHHFIVYCVLIYILSGDYN